MKPQFHWVLLASAALLLAVGCGQSAPRTPLHVAVQEGNYPAVRQHIAARTDLNARDKAGWTPLHLAAMKGDLAMVQLLTKAGADPKRTGAGGKTPVQVAREKGKTAIVQHLEATLKAAEVGQAPSEKPGRKLIDGGLGVSDVLDAN